ncbi:hypothetical protein [Runella sp. SP2]|uniref:hypothetical protein n=1 Tax=Runella sp. SP2 TaxID=2268026 RepID=UPI000F093BEA|nr:hypothetical protein [Runella sp. SP2]AYQ31368.1 hypothetical protein DTQ70_03885 [Runella sp. SP2]
MIEIKDEKGRFLELPPDTTLEQELNSWLLADDNLPGSWSYSFRFRLTPINMAFMGHKHRLEASSFTGIDVTVSIDGIPWGPAVLNFRITDSYADAFLVFDSGEIASLLSTKNLSDVFSGLSFVLCPSPELLPTAMLKTTNPETSPWPFVFFPVYNSEFTDAKAEKTDELNTDGFRHNPIVNEYTGAGFIGDFSHVMVAGYQKVNTYGNGVVPYFYLCWIIERVCAFLGYDPVGSWLQDPGVKRLVMYNNVSINVAPLGIATSVQPQYHVWKMTLGDFFKLLRTDCGIGVFFSKLNKQVVFRSFVEISTQNPTLDLSQQRLKGVTIDPIVQGGHTIQFPTVGDTKDDFSTPAPYLIGRGDKTINLQVSTLPMTIQKRRYAAFLGVNFLIPEAKERGQSLDFRYNEIKQFSLDLPDTSPRLLMYLGMQPDHLGNLYPMGSSISRNYLQQKVAGLSVHPDEPDSIFHRWTRPFWEFRSFAKPFTQRYRLKIGQSFSMRLFEPVLTESDDHVKLPCLIQKIITRWPSQDGLLTAQATLHPIVMPPDYTPLIPAGVWVRTELIPFALPFEDSTARAYTVMLRFFFDAAGTMPMLLQNDLTFHYQYQTGGYDSETKSIVVNTIRKAVRITEPAVELWAEVFWVTWANDDSSFWYLQPDEYRAYRNSLRIIPGAGYRIANG